MHLFVEEAQLFAPQRAGPDEARMLGAFEGIVRLGRNYGIGATLITQRPQSREQGGPLPGRVPVRPPGQRHARAEGARGLGAGGRLRPEARRRAPRPRRGEGYVWSPSWLRVFQRVHFAKKTTFDASATPEVGQEGARREAVAVDVEALRADLAEVVAEAEKDDPRALRRQIAELEKGARNIPKIIPAEKPPKIKEVSVLKEGHIKELRALTDRMEKSQARLTVALADIKHRIDNAGGARAPAPPPREVGRVMAAVAKLAPAVARDNAVGEVGADLPKGERVVLTAAAQHVEGVTREQISVLTTYKRSTRDKFLQHLQAGGFVDQRGDRLFATAEGLAALGSDFEPLPTGAALLDHWRNKLPEGERVVLDVAVAKYPDTVSREDIDAATNYKRSTRDKFIQHLVSRRLLALVGRGSVIASGTLFEEG
jgi:hypothetical protein